MNTRLLAILDWAESAGIDLSQTQITMNTCRYDFRAKKEVRGASITFYHAKERRANIVALKRAVSLTEHGSPPYVDLRAVVTLSDGASLNITYEGAFSCEVSHTCKPTPWKEEQIADELAAEAVGEDEERIVDEDADTDHGF